MEELLSSETSGLTRATRRNILEDDILHNHRRENLKSYIAVTGCALQRRRNVSPVRYEVGFYIPEDDILLPPCLPHDLPSRPPGPGDSSYTWQGINIMKPFLMQFRTSSVV
jgi:hypothetical protein